MLSGILFEQTSEKFKTVAGAIGSAYGNDKLSDEKFDGVMPMIVDLGIHELDFFEQEAKDMIANGIMNALENKLKVNSEW